MTGSRRRPLAVAAGVLSLPAFLCYILSSFLAIGFIVLSSGGQYGDNNLLNIAFSTSESFLRSEIIVLIVAVAVYWPLFLHMLVRFARGAAPPTFSKVYCFTILLIVIAETVRIELFDPRILTAWFGPFSSLHCMALAVLVVYDHVERQRIAGEGRAKAAMPCRRGE